jgi:hypothetical protein
MNVGRSIKLSPVLTGEPTPEPAPVVNESGSPFEGADEWEVVEADDIRATADPFPPSEQELDRESLLVEAGRLYGRDTARERVALLDGSHPLRRLERRAVFPASATR